MEECNIFKLCDHVERVGEERRVQIIYRVNVKGNNKKGRVWDYKRWGKSCEYVGDYEEL